MISIEFQQVCLVINRGEQGADIVFPETEHNLVMGPGHTRIEGPLRVIAREGSRIVQGGRTTPPSQEWIPDLGHVAGARLAPKGRPEIANSSLCRAVISVAGGRFATGEAHPPGPGYPNYSRATWSHNGWSGKLTNWVRWEIENPDRTYWLETEQGTPIVELTPDVPLVVTNLDLPQADPDDDQKSEMVSAGDFALLYAFMNGEAPGEVKPKTTRKPKPIDVGTLNPRLPLCPVGQTSEV